MHTVKPIDTQSIHEFMNHILIVTVEELNVIKCLGSAVSEYLSPKFKCAPSYTYRNKGFFLRASDYQYFLEQCGLTTRQIANGILKAFRLIAYLCGNLEYI